MPTESLKALAPVSFCCCLVNPFHQLPPPYLTRMLACGGLKKKPVPLAFQKGSRVLHPPLLKSFVLIAIECLVIRLFGLPVLRRKEPLRSHSDRCPLTFQRRLSSFLNPTSGI